jgi:UDP-2-acetamido-2-deoxy-ribo-hexuluronate aminotransferase
VYAQYTIEVENRSAVQEALKASGIPTAVHYPTLLCQQPALQSCGSRCSAGCATPLAQRASERVMSLPMHPYLSEHDQDQVVAAVAAVLR